MFALVTLSMALTVLPWTLRNWQVLGHPVVVSTNGGTNFLIGNNPEATGEYRPLASAAVRGAWHDEIARERIAYGEALTFIRDLPGQVVALAAKKVVPLFSRGWDGIYENFRFAEPNRKGTARILLYALSQLYLVGVIGSAIATVITCRRGRDNSSLLLAVIAYWSLVHMVFVSGPRYRFPIMPLLVVLSGAYVARTLSRCQVTHMPFARLLRV